MIKHSATTDHRCSGCGKSFRGERGLRSHQSYPFVTMACRPVAPSRAPR